MANVKLLLDAKRIRLAQVDKTIEELQRVQKTLQDERADIQAYLDAYTYPILSLPTEITSEIFLQTLPSPPQAPRLCGMSSPQKLLAVCSQWRRIALATHGLWHNISAVESNPWPSNDASGLPLTITIRSWIGRCGSLPLSLSWTRGVDIHSDASPLLEILPLSERWRSWSFKLDRPRLPLMSMPTSHLESLDLVCFREHEEPPLRLGETPRIRSVALWNVRFDADTLAWGNVTRLYLNEVSMTSVLPVLLHATGLVHCRLSVTAGSWDGRIRAPLPLLETLVLDYYSTDGLDIDPPSVLASALDVFTLPSLRRLQLRKEFLPAENPLRYLKSFLQRSKCQLQILQLSSALANTALPEVQATFPKIGTVRILRRYSPYKTGDWIHSWIQEEWWAEKASSSLAA
ncbi:F-box domain-containing protein [Mycena kentingensis (nom. inval.)]|nr:F-box domain-containing protein [Mycena kentingensis (nom. inval.)]